MAGRWGSTERVLVMVGLTIGLMIGTIVATATGVLAQPAAPVAVLGTSTVRVPASVERLARAATVSVDADGCAGPLLGSGVVTRGGLLVTAAHVAGGASRVTVHSSSGAVEAHPVLVAPGVDVASAPVPASWPAVGQATVDPGVGTAVEVASRARGVLRVRPATVDAYLHGTGPGDPATVMRLDVSAAPGDSGGPVLDASGRLVGIVYAAQHVSDRALVIPASELSAGLAADGTVASC